MFAVAVSYGRDLGYIEYEETTREAKVTLANDKGKALIEEFLHQVHTIRVPHKTLMDFTAEEIDPLQDEASFKLAITRLWNKTGVHVDWSRPVDYVKEHPRY